MADDEDNIFSSGNTLHIDGDILVYKPCCVFEEESSRNLDLIEQNITNMVSKLCRAADVDQFRIFLTTKLNFRDHLVDDYKANRIGKPRPPNLAHAKRFAVETFDAEFEKYLEADDLLAIYQEDDTIIWSPDKDLRQVPGWHLDVDTLQLIELDHLGAVWKEGKKHRFTGFKGFMFQCLVGDGADWIVGCGGRTGKVSEKTGFGKREGVGPAKAFKLLNDCKQDPEEFIKVVAREYVSLFGESWQEKFETQANLLYMVQDFNPDTGMIRQWTVDHRPSYMHLPTGNTYKDGHNGSNKEF